MLIILTEDYRMKCALWTHDHMHCWYHFYFEVCSWSAGDQNGCLDSPLRLQHDQLRHALSLTRTTISAGRVAKEGSTKPPRLFHFWKMVLTERQKKELNNAIFEYLSSEGTTFSRTVEALKSEGAIEGDSPDLTKCILEKKWTSVVRLQRKVMELETKIESMQQQSSLNGSLRPGSGIQAGPWMTLLFEFSQRHHNLQTVLKWSIADSSQILRQVRLIIGVYREDQRSTL